MSLSKNDKKKMLIRLKTGIKIQTCNKKAVEQLAKEMIRVFNMLPLIEASNERYVVKEDFMSMLLMLSVDFDMLISNYEIAEHISNTIKHVVKNLPTVEVEYTDLEIIKK